MSSSEKGKIAAQLPRVNRLLAMLPSIERADVSRRCSKVELELGDVVVEPGQKIRHVYFPITSFISTTATVAGSGSLEVGLIGWEGMFGIPLALGVAHSALRATVQGGGLAMRMSADEFRTILNISPAMRRILQRYAYVLSAQVAQVAVCSAFHVVEERLARWLLMTHDRAPFDTFQLTHETLAEMLGVRRAGISIAAASLQSRELISYSRGRVSVTNRKGLEQSSCECYKAAIRIYDTNL